MSIKDRTLGIPLPSSLPSLLAFSPTPSPELQLTLQQIPANLRPSQYRFLAALLMHDVKHKAAEACGFSMRTVEGWRYGEPAFRLAERLVEQAAAPEARRQLTLAILSAAAPTVAHKLVATALGVPKTDRDRTAQQRAMEAVLQHALQKPTGASEGEIETVEAIAIRIRRAFKGSKPPELPTEPLPHPNAPDGNDSPPSLPRADDVEPP